MGIVVGCGVYKFGIYLDKPNDMLEGNEDDNIITSDEITKLGKELFEKTLINYGDYPLYNDRMVTQDTISNSDKLFLVYYNSHMEFKNSDVDWSHECFDNINNTFLMNEDNCYSDRVLKKDFEDTYFNLFGNKNIIYEDFYSNYGSCKLDVNYIICMPPFGGDDSSYDTFLSFNGVQKENDNIIVYVDYLLFDSVEKYFIADLKDFDGKSKIGYLNEEILDVLNLYYKSCSFEIGSYSCENELLNNVFQYFEDKLKQFKVTFKPNDKGGYYWYSSEFVG